MLVQAKKVYKDKKDIEEFNRASEAAARRRDAISSIFQCPFLGELATRWEKIKSLKLAFGMLTELTKEQMETFEEAVRRRPLFG